MATTYKLIESQVLGSAAASVTFSAIPATYTDIVLKISARQGAENAFDLTFNGITTSYTTVKIQGDGATAVGAGGGTSAAIRGIGINPSTATANTFSNTEIYISNYTGSTYKSISYDSVNENNVTSGIYMNLGAGLWSNTSAINQITITPRAGSIVQYSSFNLYGIKNS